MSQDLLKEKLETVKKSAALLGVEINYKIEEKGRAVIYASTPEQLTLVHLMSRAVDLPATLNYISVGIYPALLKHLAA